MPVAHRHYHTRIESPAKFGLQSRGLTSCIFEDRAFSANADIMLRYVFGAPCRDETGQRLTRDPGTWEIDDVRVAKQVVQKRLNAFEGIRAAKLKENDP